MIKMGNLVTSSLLLGGLVAACTVERIDVGPLSTSNGVDGVETGSTGMNTTPSPDVGLACVAYNDAGETRSVSCDDVERVVDAGFCVQYYFDGAAGRIICPAENNQPPDHGTCSAVGTDGRTYPAPCGETTTPATSTSVALCTGFDESGNATGVPCTDVTGPIPTTTSSWSSSTAAPSYDTTTVEVTTTATTPGHETTPARTTTSAETGTVDTEPCDRANARNPRALPCSETGDAGTDAFDAGLDLGADAGTEAEKLD